MVNHKTNNNHLKAVDLFCGCGGMSLGFKRAGFDIVSGFDNWKPAIEVYQQNFNHDSHLIDIKSPKAINIINKYSPNLIVGGPPCQDFSSAGTNNLAGKRATLTTIFFNLICCILPNYFVFENVPRIKQSEIYIRSKNNLKSHDYGLTEIIIDACYCGVPQNRKRLFLIGKHKGSDDFLATAINNLTSDYPMTMRNYFGESLGIDYYFRIPTNYSKRAVYSINEPCKTIRAVDRPIPPNYKKHPSDPVYVTDNVRTLSVIERSYVQTFPRDFYFSGTKTDLNQMIGNAVPVKMAELIATALMEYIIS